MSLSASVRCRCFEEGKLTLGPVPSYDLFLDGDDCICSRKLEAARKNYDYRRFEARYGKLDDAFQRWSENCCEHELGIYYETRVSNVAGCAQFASLVREAGGRDEFPLLSNLLPDSNEGCYPAEHAAAALEELDSFIAKVPEVSEWVLCETGSERTIWSSTDSSSFTWIYNQDCLIGMTANKIFFKGPNDLYFETAHFRQVPSGKLGPQGRRPVKIIFLDQEGEVEISDSIDSSDSSEAEREFIVVSRKAPFLYEGRYVMAERIRGLLEASLATGNPIRWH